MNVVNEISSSETEGITVNPIIKDSAESLTKPTNEVIKTASSLGFGKVLLYGCIVISLVFFVVSAWLTPNPSDSKFLIYELIKQSSVVYFMVQIIGLCYIYNVSFMPKNQHMIVPVVISILV